MWIYGVLLAVAGLASQSHACGTEINLEFAATNSNHRLILKSIGSDLLFLTVHDHGYQYSRVANVKVTLVTKDEGGSSAVLRTDTGATLGISVVTDTTDLYLVKVAWTNVNGELWDCKELSKSGGLRRGILRGI